MAFTGSADAKNKGFAAATQVTDWASNTCKVGQEELDGMFYGSVAEEHWENGSVCGKCIRVRGIQGRALAKTYLIKVVDLCDNCNVNDLSLSTEALEAVQGTSAKKRIEWEWASCTNEREALTSSTGRDTKKNSSKSGRKMLSN
ncbi:hypothetical protein Ndes2526B_g02275 [Nannochloris sp. 'desiccata']|nr:hypothetical protein KSW81_003390 [Chlorella desiccata (nom. nud.)]KAH7622979.1 hypothetical protein NADE_007843 [Chlorella desiccata (nom. nud.)]